MEVLLFPSFLGMYGVPSEGEFLDPALLNPPVNDSINPPLLPLALVFRTCQQSSPFVPPVTPSSPRVSIFWRRTTHHAFDTLGAPSTTP